MNQGLEGQIRDVSASRNRLNEIEGIRGILSSVVVVGHFGLNGLILRLSSGSMSEAYWQSSVDFFFIISGFVLAYSQDVSRRTHPQFIATRFFRLLPTHVAILAIFSPYYSVHTPLNPSETLLTFGGLSYLLDGRYWNGVSWSASIELYVPLILGPLLLWLARSKALCTVLFLGLLIAQTYILRTETGIETLPGLTRGILGLGVGYTLYKLREHFGLEAFSPFGRHSTLILVVAYLAVMIFSAKLEPVGALVPALAVLAVLSAPNSASVLSSRALLFLGGLTYTLYLVHQPIYRVGIWYFGAADLNGNVPAKVALIACALVSAWLLSVTIERPFMKIVRMVVNRRAGSMNSNVAEPRYPDRT